MKLGKKLHRSESLVARAMKILLSQSVIEEPDLRRRIAGAKDGASPVAEFSLVEIGPFLVAMFDRTFAVGAARCARWEGEDGYGNFEELGV